MGQTLRLTAGQAVAKFLQNQYSERDGKEQRLIPKAFGIFGHGNLSGLGQGFEECGQDIEFYQPFHEQSMVHSAVAFARAKRRLATFACTSSIGPGTTNLYTGAAGATVQRVPVLLLPSDHYANRRQGVVLQQLEHPTSYDLGVTEGLRSVSTFFDRIMRPEQIIPSLLDAMRVLTSTAEAGAVTIAMCQDVQGEAYDYPVEFFERRVWHVDRRVPEREAVARVVERLCQAKRPLIISGGGVYYSEAEAELAKFAETFSVPVVETVAGRGTIAGESPMAVGAVGIAGNSAANEMAHQADFVLAIGTRLSDVITCSQTLFQDPAVSFASINVVGRDAIKQAAEPILADARRGLEALSDAASQAGVTKQSDWTDRLQVVKSDWVQMIAPTLEAPASGPLTQGQALAIINDACKPDSYVVSAAGSLPGDINKLWNTCENKRCHLEFGFSCMTYEIPAGIGLILSGETKHVYVCIGDGTYLMNPSDLITAAREGLKLTVIVFVNHGYQIIRDLQVATTGTGFATEFRRRGNSGQLDGPYLDIDIAKNAASLGATAFSAQDAAGLREALRTAEDTAGVSVIALEVDPHKMSLLPKHGFWDIAPPSVSANETTRERRAQYEEMRKLQRYHL